MESNPDKLEQFRRTWQSPAGFAGWLTEVNNQPIGKRFMITAFIFFLLGGVLALLMRVQLAVSENTFMDPQVYNQLFTMHGSTMMYLFAVPFLEGLALYLLPLMLGSRDVAFPRLTAFGWWCYLFGGVIFYASFLVGAVPDTGWFAYPPLSGPRAGIGQDFWLMGLALVEIAGITAAIEIVVTILLFRAPGMSINRLPLFAWAMLVAGIMIIFAFTTLLMATVLLELDRAAGTRFFDPDHGGNTLLWQHLFWFFGHPEVYIMFIPATGIVSMVVAIFARRIVGYTLIAVAIMVTGFLSFGLWVHHMYTTGLPELSMHFFAAASLMIAIASGVQVFAWIGSLWGSRPAFTVPLMFILGFLFLFVLGGFTGVMVAITPFDWQVHDTFFLVAHFHYVLIGGVVFPIFAALHLWLPKITGRMLSEPLGQWSFWLTFIGFNLTFFPMHIMGFFGMPRRVYTYSESLGIDGYNFAATIGAFIFALGAVLFVVNFFYSLRRGEPTDENPWGGDTLEWSLPSPPPMYAFYAPPIVHSRHPLWGKAPRGRTESLQRASAALEGRPHNWRGTLATDVLTGEPRAVQWLPGPSYKPLFAALGLLVAALGVLTDSYRLSAVAAVFTAGAIANWLWPAEGRLRMLRTSHRESEYGLPVFTTGTSSTAWWAMICLLGVLGTAFGVLFYAYFYIRLFSETWPQGDIARPAILLPLSALVLLILSAGPHYWAMRTFREGTRGRIQLGLAGSLLPGALFLGLQLYELDRQAFVPQDNAYASLFFTIHWLLSLVVITALALNIAAQLRIHKDYSDREGYMVLQMQVTSLLWYFTIAAGVAVFGVLYLSPYLI